MRGQKQSARGLVFFPKLLPFLKSGSFLRVGGPLGSQVQEIRAQKRRPKNQVGAKRVRRDKRARASAIGSRRAEFEQFQLGEGREREAAFTEGRRKFFEDKSKHLRCGVIFALFDQEQAKAVGGSGGEVFGWIRSDEVA